MCVDKVQVMVRWNGGLHSRSCQLMMDQINEQNDSHIKGLTMGGKLWRCCHCCCGPAFQGLSVDNGEMNGTAQLSVTKLLTWVGIKGQSVSQH